MRNAASITFLVQRNLFFWNECSFQTQGMVRCLQMLGPEPRLVRCACDAVCGSVPSFTRAKVLPSPHAARGGEAVAVFMTVSAYHQTLIKSQSACKHWVTDSFILKGSMSWNAPRARYLPSHCAFYHNLQSSWCISINSLFIALFFYFPNHVYLAYVANHDVICAQKISPAFFSHVSTSLKFL